MSGHPSKAKSFNSRPDYVSWHDQAVYFVRQKRDKAASTVSNWEQLRDKAARIKRHTLSRLPYYLETFEENARKNGMIIHWAKDGKEHNQIVLKLLKEKNISRVVKSKSMLTEECHLNPFLEKKGIEIIDTDLGERIVQLAEQPPSHIVLPAIHMKKEDVGSLFHRTIGTPAGESDPAVLTGHARVHLREKFLNAQAAMTGVNFAVAETGSIVVCTNEGNADMGTTLNSLHIASMGLEKVIPGINDLGVFTRLLARSATGQAVTTYTTHYNGPPENGELHVIIVDNGRSGIIEDETLTGSLSCIRCGACINTCPVYRRSGGHSYGYAVPGPIGSLLAPGRDLGKFKTLPFASSLCGSCDNVCPVKIDIHHLLLKLREKAADEGRIGFLKKLSMKAAGWILSSPARYNLITKAGVFFLKWTPGFIINNPLNKWGRTRELPRVTGGRFRDQIKKRKK